MTRIMTPADVSEFKRRFSYDPEEGGLRNKERLGSRPKGARAGCLQKDRGGDRWHVRVRGKSWLATRIIFAMMTGEPTPTSHVVDHINGTPSDDRWGNLRLATRSENHQNCRVFSTNTTGATGVYLNPRTGHWYARIIHNRKITELGTFRTLEGATEARRAAELIYHGEFGSLVGAQSSLPKTLNPNPF